MATQLIAYDPGTMTTAQLGQKLFQAMSMMHPAHFMPHVAKTKHGYKATTYSASIGFSRNQNGMIVEEYLESPPEPKMLTEQRLQVWAERQITKSLPPPFKETDQGIPIVRRSSKLF